MAEPLKNQFGPNIPKKIAAMIAAVYPAFNSSSFIRDALDGYEPLNLLARGKKIAHALQRHLPADYPNAIKILVESSGAALEKTQDNGMAPFLYLPHVTFVREFGLDHFEESMRAQYELTQRFSAEFSIRPFIERYPDQTLARLKNWAKDASVHVRRLVSEGTRPRLPWASRLTAFQKNPAPVLELLELLKDDPDIYVRRSVANNLNDIGKDHAALLVKTAAMWMKNATPERRWIVRHALRSAIKRGDAVALKILGFKNNLPVMIKNTNVAPRNAAIGHAVTIAFDVENPTAKPHRVLVDFRIHYVKANGRSAPKVFKLTKLELAPKARVRLTKRIALKQMTTRKHYPGTHRIDILLNGAIKPLGAFKLRK